MLNAFANTVFKMGAKYQRIDVVFGRYQGETSAMTEQQAAPPTGEKERSVPLLSSWSRFIILEENRADLAVLGYFQTISLINKWL